jgi:hypothetical protein
LVVFGVGGGCKYVCVKEVGSLVVSE